MLVGFPTLRRPICQRFHIARTLGMEKCLAETFSGANRKSGARRTVSATDGA
jgi:hypothetical protein